MKHIKKYVEMMTHENVSRAMVVLQQNLTPFAKSFLIELEPKIHLEVFQVSLHTMKKLFQFDSQSQHRLLRMLLCNGLLFCYYYF
jgi:hypothetical protein